MRCFRPEIALPSLRSLCPLAAMLACFALLAGCRFGQPASFFDDENAIEQAVAAIRDRVGKPVHAFNLLIMPQEVTIRIQDANNRNRVDEWRLERMHVVAVNWDRVSGPTPYQLTLINPDLEANLFDLDEIDFTASTKLARAALERAGLAGKARVNRMEIARQVYLLPAPSSGEIRWTVDVTSDHESVQAFADAHGTIVGMNIDGTDRAKNLDILKQLDLVTEAARAFRFVLGPDKILTAVRITPRAISFETSLADSSASVSNSTGAVTNRIYNWNLNGLQRASAGPDGNPAIASPVAATRYAAFSVDDVDWSAAPKIVASAAEQLSMPQGRVAAIELSKPITDIVAPVVLWKVAITDQNKEFGFILADIAGTVKQIVPPDSRRKTVDWYDPATMAGALQRLGAELGQDRQYAEITFFTDSVIITAEDHMQPNSFSQIMLTGTSLSRIGKAVTGAAKSVPFRIGDLSALTADRIRDLETKTLETLKMPPKTIASITIGRTSMDPSPNGNVTIEIRAEERRGGRAGRVNYELDGTVIKTYLP